MCRFLTFSLTLRGFACKPYFSNCSCYATSHIYNLWLFERIMVLRLHLHLPVVQVSLKDHYKTGDMAIILGHTWYCGWLSEVRSWGVRLQVTCAKNSWHHWKWARVLASTCLMFSGLHLDLKAPGIHLLNHYRCCEQKRHYEKIFFM